MAKKKIINMRRKKLKNLLKKKAKEVQPVDDSFNLFMHKEQTCQRCGKCCKSNTIELTQADLDREPRLLTVSHPVKPSEQEKYNPYGIYCRLVRLPENNGTCPLYKDGIGCSIYDTRPSVCRDYIPSHYNCLMARLGSAGLPGIQSWYNDNKCLYCETQLHRYTGLHPIVDNKTVYLYSLIMPFLFSEDKVKEHVPSQKDERLKSRDYTLDDLIDVNEEIPSCLREYLQLDDKYKTIKDLFNPDALSAVLNDL